MTPTDATWLPAVRRFGHIDRAMFVRLSPPDWCRRFDRPSGLDLSDAVDQIDAAAACRTGAGKRTLVRCIGRYHRSGAELICMAASNDVNDTGLSCL